MVFEFAPDISLEIKKTVDKLNLNYIEVDKIICFRSSGSSSRARARIWSLPRIWQMALHVDAHYCIEVLSERYDKLSQDEKQRTIIHELLHIPKNFSGALVPHRTRYGRLETSVEKLFKIFKNT